MKKAFVLGHPIEHSKSPLIHNYWIKKYQIDAKYEALDYSEENLNAFLELLQEGAYVGGNITLPHKVSITKHCDVLTPDAKMIGATNTLYFQKSSNDKLILTGANTDMYGFLANLDTISKGWDTGLQTGIILGAGGASRAVIAALIARKCKNIVILNRTVSKAEILASIFAATQSTSILLADTMENFVKYAQNANVLINTTSVGMNNTEFDNLPLHSLPPSALVTDIVYTPLITPLLKQAEELGLNTVGGLGMLLHQAVPGFEKWFGVRPEVDEILTSLLVSSLN